LKDKIYLFLFVLFDIIDYMPIKNIKFPKIILAPLSDVSDWPFRMLNRSHGCKFAYSQMVSARALINNKSKTKELLRTSFWDRPLGVQILADIPQALKDALFILRDYKYKTIDLNAGCPTPKVAKKGQGSGLLKDLKLLKELMSTLVEFSDKPATIKIRTGWQKDNLVAVEIAKMAQEAGLAAIFIHGRTREDYYKGKVDYKTIKKVKEAVEIPVIASGDILSPELARKMFDETGCDGIMVARGALGNPWIFRQIEYYLACGRQVKKPSVKELRQVMKKHLSLSCRFYGEELGVLKFRKHFTWYVKGLRYSRPLRNKAFLVDTKRELNYIIDKLK
jgi:tRNA-dihydrouridine synthase B